MIDFVAATPATQSPIAQTIDLLGDRLTIAILRDAFVDHVRRFNQWIERTGAPPAVLTSRLNDLVEAGVLARRDDLPGRDRYDYWLTDLGMSIWEFLISVWAWERQWSPEGRFQPELIHRDCGHRGAPSLMCRHCDRTVGVSDVELEMEPGSLSLAARSGRRRTTRTPQPRRADLQLTEVLEAIGDRWSALVAGLALSGVSRFSEFQSALNISPTTLTDRLARLENAKMLVRESGQREYALTPKGRGLLPIFAFQLAWAQLAFPATAEPGLWLRHHDCASPVLAPALRCRGCDRVIERTAVRFE